MEHLKKRRWRCSLLSLGPLSSSGWRQITWWLFLEPIYGRFLFFCLGLLPVLYSKANIKPLFTFCPEDCCQLWTEIFLEDLPTPPSPASRFWLSGGDDKLWHLASGHVWWTLYQSWTHETTVSQGVIDSRAAWWCFPCNFYIWKQFCQLLFSDSMILYSNMTSRGNFNLGTKGKKW